MLEKYKVKLGVIEKPGDVITFTLAEPATVMCRFNGGQMWISGQKFPAETLVVGADRLVPPEAIEKGVEDKAVFPLTAYRFSDKEQEVVTLKTAACLPVKSLAAALREFHILFPEVSREKALAKFGKELEGSLGESLIEGDGQPADRALEAVQDAFAILRFNGFEELSKIFWDELSNWRKRKI